MLSYTKLLRGFSSCTPQFAVVFLVFFLCGCDASVPLPTKIKVNHPQAKNVLKVTENFHSNAHAVLNAGIHDLGDPSNNVKIIVPIPKTRVELSLERVPATADGDLDIGKSKGKLVFSFQDYTPPNGSPKLPKPFPEINWPSMPAPPVFVVIQYDLPGIGKVPTLVVPVSSIAWDNDDVSLLPNVDDLHAYPDDDPSKLPIPAVRWAIKQVLAQHVTKAAQFICTVVVNGIQTDKEIQTTQLSGPRLSKLWKELVIDDAVFDLKRQAMLSLAGCDLQLHDKDSSFIRFEKLVFDSNFNYQSGRFQSTLSFVKDTVCQLSDLFVRPFAGKLNIDFSVLRSGSNLSLKADTGKNSVGLENVYLAINDNQEKSSVKAKRLVVSMGSCEFNCDMESGSTTTSGNISSNIDFGIVDDESDEKEQFGLLKLKIAGGQMNGRILGSNTSKVIWQKSASAPMAFSFGIGPTNFAEVNVEQMKDDKLLDVQVAHISFDSFSGSQFTNCVLKTGTGAIEPQSFQYRAPKQSLVVEFAPKNVITFPHGFEIQIGDGSSTIKAFEVGANTLIRNAILANEKKRLTFNDLKGSLKVDVDKSIDVTGDLEFTANFQDGDAPIEYRELLEKLNARIAFKGFSLSTGSTESTLNIKQGIFSTPADPIMQAIRNKIPDEIKIPEGLGHVRVVHVWDVTTIGDSWIRNLRNGTQIRLTGPNTISVSAHPIFRIRTVGRYNHCRWFSCDVREQRWKIDGAVEARGAVTADFVPGDSLATSSMKTKLALVPSSVEVTITDLEGMNGTIKSLIRIVENLQWWINLGDKVAQAVDRTDTFPILPEDAKDEFKNFFVGSLTFAPKDRNMVFTMTDAKIKM